jgi:hypothetical protein
MLIQVSKLGDRFITNERVTEVKDMIAANDAIDNVVEKCIKDVARLLGTEIIEFGDLDSTVEVREMVLTELSIRLGIRHYDAGEY